MRRLLSLPAALILIAALGAGVASADPVDGPNSLLLVGTCDDGSTWSTWVTPAHGAVLLDTSSTTVAVTLALKLYSNGQLFEDFVRKPAEKIPAGLTTVCSGYVLGDPSITFWQLSLVTPV